MGYFNANPILKKISALIVGFISGILSYASENTTNNFDSRMSVRTALKIYESADSYFKNSSGNISRTVTLLLGEEARENDRKFLSMSIAQYGLPSSHSFKIQDTQVKVTDKNKVYVVELEGLYQGKIKLNGKLLSVNLDYEKMNLQEKYRAVELSVKNSLLQEERELVSFFNWNLLHLFIPRAEAMGGWFGNFFQGAGASLTGASQRARGLRIDPSVRSGAVGHNSPYSEGRNVNRNWFRNYQPPMQGHSGGGGTSKRSVYQLPSGGRLSTYGNPPTGSSFVGYE
jgi:hypothetical protein